MYEQLCEGSTPSFGTKSIHLIAHHQFILLRFILIALAKKKVAIIGAGITGLVCAYYLQRAGIKYQIFESNDRVGGRVHTIRRDGYKLDVGFQIFLEGYPEFKNILDYKALELGYFYSGALIHDNHTSIKLGNPLREGIGALGPALSSWATWSDKIRLLNVYIDALRYNDNFKVNNETTLEYLEKNKFSKTILRRFFRPFIGDVFLDRDLSPDSSFFLFLFKMFASSRASLPKAGMQAIPEQIAALLDTSSVSLDTPLLNPISLIGEYTHVVNSILPTDNTSYFATTNMYFHGKVEKNPGPILCLNVQDDLIRNASVISQVQPSYSNSIDDLLSVSLSYAAAQYSSSKLEEVVKKSLTAWFGDTSELKLLDKFDIPLALPKISNNASPFYKIKDKIISCGDYLAYPSLNGAAASGRQVAEYIIAL